MTVNSIIITCCAQNNVHRGLAAAKEIAQRFKMALLIVMCIVLFQFTFDSSILAVNAEALPYQTLTNIEGKAISAPQTHGKTLLLFFNPYHRRVKNHSFTRNCCTRDTGKVD
jgi:hypothetical protein